jgi:hypothetical protein
MDYQANSNRSKEKEVRPEKADKKIEKVVVGEVVVQKKGIGRKIKDLFIEADFRSVSRYVFMEVLVPAAKNMVVDGVESGIRRIAYGEASRRRMHGSHITYNNPINRYRDPRDYNRDPRVAPRPTVGPRSVTRPDRDVAIVLASREDAEKVLEGLNDIIDSYEIATWSDLNELLGQPSNHVDHKWGWVGLLDVPIRQIREGYLLELPPAEPIS